MTGWRQDLQRMGDLLLLFDVPILNVQLLLDGILIGAIFALAAYGFAGSRWRLAEAGALPA